MRQNRCEERKETERLIKRLVYYPDLTTPPAAASISVSGGVSSLSSKRDICKNQRKCIAKREKIWYTIFVDTGKLKNIQYEADIMIKPSISYNRL